MKAARTPLLYGLVARQTMLNGGIVLLSQLLSSIPSTLTMGRLGIGPFSAVFLAQLLAALASFPLAAIGFALFERRRTGWAGSVLLGAACSIASFPVAYSLKALWDALSDGETPGSLPGAILAMLMMTVGVMAIATSFIPYLFGGLAGYIIWWRRVRHSPPAL